MARSPFTVNWNDLEAVKKYADELQRGCDDQIVVIKMPNRDNYNITFETRTNVMEESFVVYRAEF